MPLTEEEGNYYITMALLHGPSTLHDVSGGRPGNHDPLYRSITGLPWWVHRDGICSPNYRSQAEAAKAYCDHYNIPGPPCKTST